MLGVHSSACSQAPAQEGLGGGGWEGLGKGRGVVGGKSQGNIDVFTGGKRSDFLGAHSGSLESCAFLS